MAVHRWQALTTVEFSALPCREMVAVLPLGATEQHGPHLPVGTDALIVEAVLQRALERVAELDLVWLPALWCTKSDEHRAFAGSLSLRAETLMAVLHDLTAGIAAAGFRRLVILNWHGGNSDLVSALARDLRLRQGVWVFVVDIIRSFPAAPSPVLPGEPPPFDIHGGRFETSLLLAAQPDLVRPGPYTSIGADYRRGRMAERFSGYRFLSPEGGRVQVGWESTDLTADGVIGDPAGANPSEGAASLEQMVDQVACMLREIAQFPG